MATDNFAKLINEIEVGSVEDCNKICSFLDICGSYQYNSQTKFCSLIDESAVYGDKSDLITNCYIKNKCSGGKNWLVHADDTGLLEIPQIYKQLPTIDLLDMETLFKSSMSGCEILSSDITY